MNFPGGCEGDHCPSSFPPFLSTCRLHYIRFSSSFHSCFHPIPVPPAACLSICSLLCFLLLYFNFFLFHPLLLLSLLLLLFHLLVLLFLFISLLLLLHFWYFALNSLTCWFFSSFPFLLLLLLHVWFLTITFSSVVSFLSSLSSYFFFHPVHIRSSLTPSFPCLFSNRPCC